MLNPLVLKVAGRRRFGMVAQVHHVGRRSGHRYTTPLGARPTATGFVIPLTFGRDADWCRNVIAADGCQIRFKNRTYTVADPTIADTARAGATVRGVFRRHERMIFRLGGINEFLLLETVLDAG